MNIVNFLYGICPYKSLTKLPSDKKFELVAFQLFPQTISQEWVQVFLANESNEICFYERFTSVDMCKALLKLVTENPENWIVINPREQGVYAFTHASIYINKNIKVKNKLSVDFSRSSEYPYFIYKSSFKDIYRDGSPAFCICFASDISYDFSEIMNVFENRKLLTNAARYKYDFLKQIQSREKEAKKYQQRVNKLNSEIDELQKFVDGTEIDARLFKYFGEDIVNSARLAQELKGL